jgi:type I restriction enzyme S subunit
MTAKPYPKYKPSGMSWLGEVPEHWDLLRSDAVLKTYKTQIAPEQFHSREVFHYSIPAIQESGTGLRESGSDISSGKLLVTERVLLVSKLNPRKGTVCVAEPQDITTVCSTEFVPLIASRCNLGFLRYLVLSEPFRQELESKVASVTNSHQRANPADVYRFWSAWPSLAEQQNITDFLDRECAKLDSLSGKNRQLIEKLKQKRTALISRAVTRGLPPAAARAAGLAENPPLKSSGIDWLGDMPEHWQLLPSKRVGSFIGGAGFPPELQGEKGLELPFYKVADLKESLDVKYLAEGSNSVSIQTARALNAKVIPSGAVLYAKIGAALLLNRRRLSTLSCCIDNNMSAFVPSARSVLSLWAFYWFTILDFERFMQPGAVPSFSEGRQELLPILVPPVNEQKALCGYLDRECEKVDLLISKIEAAIEKLKEYRAALISAAVTGKIDVRDAAQNPSLN